MLTVVLATRNGAETLPDVLTAYGRLEPPLGGFCVVIVDNGSTDQTKAIVHSFASKLPVTYLFEATPGKNAALNAGLARAVGDLMVFTDDDSVPGTDWLRQLRAAADEHPDYAVFGGRVVPRWPAPPPDWILRWVPLGPVFAISPPLESGPVRHSWVFGPNMAMRRAIFDQGYRFDPTIGPRGASYAQGSEAELVRRVTNAGFKAWFCAEAVVEHIIRSSQLTESWILGRARRYGRGTYRLRQSSASVVIPVVGLPLRPSVSLVTQTLRLVIARVRRDPEAWFKARWTWYFIVGCLHEAYQLHRQGGQSR